MPSHRLKTRSNFPLRTRSIQRPSLLTGTRTTSDAQSSRALSTASMESSSCTSGALPRAESPSNSNAIFIGAFSSFLRSAQSARGERTLTWSNSRRHSGFESHTLPRCRVLQTALNQFVVSDPRGPCRFRKARVVCRIRKNPWQWIHLENVGHARGIESHIYPRPVFTAENTERVERNSLNRRLKRTADTRRTLENVERFLGPIPNELRIEAVDGQ